jgi:hypothetical protein
VNVYVNLSSTSLFHTRCRYFSMLFGINIDASLTNTCARVCLCVCVGVYIYMYVCVCVVFPSVCMLVHVYGT